jgi:hypothetical protein
VRGAHIILGHSPDTRVEPISPKHTTASRPYMTRKCLTYLENPPNSTARRTALKATVRARHGRLDSETPDAMTARTAGAGSGS